MPQLQILVNGESLEIAPATTITGLLEQMRLKRQYVAVEVNRELVPREEHAKCELRAGDEIEIVTLVGGG